MLIFSVHALSVGGLFSRIAEIQRDLGLSEAAFGLVLAGIPIGALTGSLLVSRMIERGGTGRTLLIFMPLFSVTPVLAALASDGSQLFAALILFGLTLSCANITMNVEADRVEAFTRSKVLNRCHGSWGMAFLAVSSLGVAAIWLGVSPRTYFSALLICATLATVVLVRSAEFAPPRRRAGEAAPKRFALPNRGTFLIVGYVLAGMWFEGTIRNWGVIYLRDGFGALDWHAALALPATMITQTIGRFMADRWINRFGDVAVARCLTGFSLTGFLLIVATHNTAIALLGFSMIGLGISTIFPQAVSAAAGWGDRPASENVAAFSSLQTIISFAAPPVIGLLAAWLGLRIAFAVFLPLPIAAFYFAKYLHPRHT